MPSYAKFLKEILKNKRRIEDGTVALTEECSALIQDTLPPKLKDPGSFTLPCLIGNVSFDYALCDLGASVNLMPLSLYRKLDIGELKKTNISLQLADRSLRHPVGMLENVPIRIGKFFIPTDFVVLDMAEDSRLPIILGRPFLATSGALIDVKKGKLTLHIGEDSIEFAINANKKSSSAETCSRLDSVENYFEELEGVEDMSEAFALCFSESHEEGSTKDHSPSNTKEQVASTLKKSLKDLVMVFNPRAKLLTGRLRPTWSGPFQICGIFSDGGVELKGQRKNFKVAKERIKDFEQMRVKGQSASS